SASLTKSDARAHVPPWGLRRGVFAGRFRGRRPDADAAAPEARRSALPAVAEANGVLRRPWGLGAEPRPMPNFEGAYERGEQGDQQGGRHVSGPLLRAIGPCRGVHADSLAWDG